MVPYILTLRRSSQALDRKLYLCDQNTVPVGMLEYVPAGWFSEKCLRLSFINQALFEQHIIDLKQYYLANANLSTLGLFQHLFAKMAQQNIRMKAFDKGIYCEMDVSTLSRFRIESFHLLQLEMKNNQIQLRFDLIDEFNLTSTIPPAYQSFMQLFISQTKQYIVDATRPIAL